jgi:hypothetical protein
MSNKINNFADLEIAAKQFEEAVSYNENCPLTVRNRNISWWNQNLAQKRRKVRKLFNNGKKSGNWTDYKRNLTVYNKADRLRQNHGEDSEEIEMAPECGRLRKILSKDEQSSTSSNLKMETTQNRKGPWKNYSGSTSLVRK